MPISELLLTEFDAEMKTTRTTLERIPAGKEDFRPHPKSMPLNKLGPHVAELAGFGHTVLTTPELDFSQGSSKRVAFESNDQLVRVFDEGAAKVRAALKNTPDEAWTQNWKLSFQGKPIFNGSRYDGILVGAVWGGQECPPHTTHYPPKFKAFIPKNLAPSPNSSSIRSNWLYFAMRSVREAEPVLIWPAPVATARSAMNVSSVSPER